MTRLLPLALLLAAPLAAQAPHDAAAHGDAAHGDAAASPEAGVEPGAGVEPDAGAEAAFVATVRAEIARFRDQDAAVAAGFRPLGPDMPHMGQHWVHPGRAVSRTFEAALPSMLTYLDVGGTPVLTGAAFTVPVGPGEAPPPFPSAGAWHAHAGRLMDEAFGLVPHGVQGEGQARLAMLHVWTEAPNPDGVWAADHWGLPFVRLGLPVPAHVPPAAGRAVALVAGYRPFFEEAARRAGDPTAGEEAWLAARLAEHAARVEALVAERPGDVAALGAAWLALWGAVERGARPALVEAWRPLFSGTGHTGTHAIGPDRAQPAGRHDHH